HTATGTRRPSRAESTSVTSSRSTGNGGPGAATAMGGASGDVVGAVVVDDGSGGGPGSPARAGPPAALPWSLRRITTLTAVDTARTVVTTTHAGGRRTMARDARGAGGDQKPGGSANGSDSAGASTATVCTPSSSASPS